jgi:multiple sugar transport system ATP-binding protein
MVFQNYALYPHMTVRQNMAFSMKLSRAPKEAMDAEVLRAASILGLEPYLERFPRQLSGGQRQRVAMGRAIVREPKQFLFDEPLSNLDAKLRVQMRVEIKKLQRDLGVTALYVTHDQVEAMTLATRVAVFNKGVLQQLGPPLELYNRPTNTFVATFLGSPSMNLLDAKREGDRFAGNGFSLPAIGDASGAVKIGLRPQDLRVGAEGPIRGEVEAVERLGFDGYAFLKTSAGPVAARFENVDVQVGQTLAVTPTGDALHVFSSDGSKALRHPEAPRG